MSVAFPPLAAVGASSLAMSPFAMPLGPLSGPGAPSSVAPDRSVAPGGFGDLLKAGLSAVDAKLETADALVRRFAVDDSVPVHHVTIALEEARLAVELAMQVRGRLVEGYRELMNMQL